MDSERREKIVRFFQENPHELWNEMMGDGIDEYGRREIADAADDEVSAVAEELWKVRKNRWHPMARRMGKENENGKKDCPVCGEFDCDCEEEEVK